MHNCILTQTPITPVIRLTDTMLEPIFSILLEQREDIWCMFKVIGADSLVNDEINGYFGDPVVERRIE